MKRATQEFQQCAPRIMKRPASVETGRTGRALPRIEDAQEDGRVIPLARQLVSERELLSTREYQVAAMLAAGKLNKTIALELGLDMRTVSCFVTRARRKLGLANALQLALHAYSQGWREWKP